MLQYPRYSSGYNQLQVERWSGIQLTGAKSVRIQDLFFAPHYDLSPFLYLCFSLFALCPSFCLSSLSALWCILSCASPPWGPGLPVKGPFPSCLVPARGRRRWRDKLLEHRGAHQWVLRRLVTAMCKAVTVMLSTFSPLLSSGTSKEPHLLVWLLLHLTCDFSSLCHPMSFDNHANPIDSTMRCMFQSQPQLSFLSMNIQIHRTALLNQCNASLNIEIACKCQFKLKCLNAFALLFTLGRTK